MAMKTELWNFFEELRKMEIPAHPFAKATLIGKLLLLHSIRHFEDVYQQLGLTLSQEDSLKLNDIDLSLGDTDRLLALLLNEKLGSTRQKRKEEADGSIARLSRNIEIYVANIAKSHPGQQGVYLIGEDFSQLIERIARSDGMRSDTDQMTPPANLAQLQAKALDVHPEMTVLDLTPRAGQTLVAIASNLRARGYDPNSVKYLGWEGEIRTTLAAVNLALNGVTNFKFQKNEIPPKSEDYTATIDRVFGTPPFGQSVQQDRATPSPRFNFGSPSWPRTVEWLYVQVGLKSLKPGGRAVFISPPSLLFHSGVEAEIRRDIVAAGWLRSVIGLPSALYAYTAIPVAMTVFERPAEGGSGHTNILMVDASGLGDRQGRYQTLTDERVLELAQLLEQPREELERSKIVERMEIHANGDVWQPSRYVTRKEEEIRPQAEIAQALQDALVNLTQAQERVMAALRQITSKK